MTFEEIENEAIIKGVDCSEICPLHEIVCFKGSKLPSGEWEEPPCWSYPATEDADELAEEILYNQEIQEIFTKRKKRRKKTNGN